MRKATWLIVAVLVLMAATWSAAEEIAGLPLHVKKLGPTAIRVWVGDYVSSSAPVAFATSKGIVVVDTLGIPSLDAELRKVFARELGRRDFTMLINTHEHADHTRGNVVYEDCTIVGHEQVAAGMNAWAGDDQRAAERLAKFIQEGDEKLAKLDPGSKEAKELKERLTIHRLNLEARQAGTKLVPPNRTFKDRLKLSMGDTTFDMFFIGGMHSASDIAIFVPEQGVLLTGDTMADAWLTDSPGCLASFVARPGIAHDFPLWLASWQAILAQRDTIKLLLPGHWNGELSLKGAEARVAYVRTLWDGVQKAAQQGKTLDEVQAAYLLADRFPELVNSPGCSLQNHSGTVTEMWQIASGQESAALKLYALLNEDGGKAVIGEVLAERGKQKGKYYFSEAEINA